MKTFLVSIGVLKMDGMLDPSAESKHWQVQAESMSEALMMCSVVEARAEDSLPE